MSNLIKAYSIRYEEKIKTLDLNNKAEQMEQKFLDSEEGKRRLSATKDFEKLTFSEADEPDETDDRIDGEENFVAGIIPAANLDEQQEQIAQNEQKLLAQEQRLDEITAQSQEILSQAKEEAKRIFSEAESEAEERKQEIFSQARQDGYEAGCLEAKQELEDRKKELEEYEKELSRNYEKQVSEIEPAFVEILIKYIRKLTGVICDERRDIITYLIDSEIKQQENGKSYIVRVSPQDYETVVKQRERFEALIAQDAQLEIIEDRQLGRLKCMIEIDSRLFDCSLDVGVEGLIGDLKLLARAE